MNKILKKPLELMRSLFFNGILIVLPITLTFLLFGATFRLIKSWLVPLHDYLPANIQAIPHSEIIVVVGSILLIGGFVKFFVLKPIIHAIEKHIVFRIPLVRPVYSGIKQLVSAFTSQDKLSFNTVVLLEFPSEGIHCIGFMTGNFPKELSPTKDKLYYNIYVPTTPNPTTGYFILLPQSKFKVINLTRQEAMSIIISGGIIKPDRFM
jgi:uncharacterized membrane protein